MNDSPDKIFLFQNPYDFGRALKKKNYGLTHLIEQTPFLHKYLSKFSDLLFFFACSAYSIFAVSAWSLELVTL